MPVLQREIDFPSVKAPRCGKLQSPVKDPQCLSPSKIFSPNKINSGQAFASPKRSLKFPSALRCSPGKALFSTPTLSLKEKIALARAKKLSMSDSKLTRKLDNSPVNSSLTPSFYKKQVHQLQNGSSINQPCKKAISSRYSPMARTTVDENSKPMNRAAAVRARKKLALESESGDVCLLKRLQSAESAKTDKELSETKKHLHCSMPNSLVGRVQEYQEIKQYIDDHIHKKTSGCMYISGAPGTGKTAVLSKLLSSYRKDFNVAYVNCTSVKKPSAIFEKINVELKIKRQSSCLPGLHKFLQQSSTATIICLDEADQLDCKDQSVLYSLFELPTLPDANTICITVANSLDLTDRLLPRLKLRPEYRPILMHFSPYSQQELFDILNDRVKHTEMIEAAALELCARKVSSVAGDARRALNACRRAVELVEVSASQPQPSELGHVTALHMSRLLGDTYGQQEISNIGEHAPIQQLVAACAVNITLRKDKAKTVSVSKVHTTYVSVCQRQKIEHCDFSQFLSLCDLLESRGVLAIKPAKNPRVSKVSMEMDEDTLQSTLGNKALLSTILKTNT